MDVAFRREHPDGSTRNTMAYLNSESVILLNQSQTAIHLEDAIRRINTLVDVFTNEGLGWTIDHIGNVTLHMATYDAIGSSSHIKSTKWLALKTATLNIRNDDNKCFLYCVLAAAHHMQKNAERITKYTPLFEWIKCSRSNLPSQDWSNSDIWNQQSTFCSKCHVYKFRWGQNIRALICISTSKPQTYG